MISLLFGYEQVAKRIANIRLTRSKKMKRKILVTVHIPLSREVFWHEYAKIPRHTSQIPLPQAIWNEFWLRYCERSEQ